VVRFTSYLIETLWVNRGIVNGLKKHYEVVKQVSDELNGVEFLGLFKPKTEPWNWATFSRVNDLEAMVKLDHGVSEHYEGFNKNIINSITRLYDKYNFPEESVSIRALEELDLLVHENYICKGVDVGIKEIAEEESSVCGKIDGIVYLGMYAPWSELVNWSPIFFADSISKYAEYNNEFYKRFGRPDNITLTSTWFYERYTP
jgi:hypothetical protein